MPIEYIQIPPELLHYGDRHNTRQKVWLANEVAVGGERDRDRCPLTASTKLLLSLHDALDSILTPVANRYYRNIQARG